MRYRTLCGVSLGLCRPLVNILTQCFRVVKCIIYIVGIKIRHNGDIYAAALEAVPHESRIAASHATAIRIAAMQSTYAVSRRAVLCEAGVLCVTDIGYKLLIKLGQPVILAVDEHVLVYP